MMDSMEVTEEQKIRDRIGQRVRRLRDGRTGTISTVCVRPETGELVYVEYGGYFVVDWDDSREEDAWGCQEPGDYLIPLREDITDAA